MRLEIEVKDENRKRRWKDSLSEVNGIHCLKWDLTCVVQSGGGGFNIGGEGRYMVWGRVCPDWEACSLYLLKVGMREWEKLGKSRM